jgi:membrane protein DedA with SNARE-associated domain
VDPVSWIEHMAKASPVLLLVVVVLVMFVDGLALIGAMLPGDLLLLVPAAGVGLSGAPIVVAGAVIGTVLGTAGWVGGSGPSGGNKQNGCCVARQAAPWRWSSSCRCSTT